MQKEIYHTNVSFSHNNGNAAMIRFLLLLHQLDHDAPVYEFIGRNCESIILLGGINPPTILTQRQTHHLLHILRSDHTKRYNDPQKRAFL